VSAQRDVDQWRSRLEETRQTLRDRQQSLDQAQGRAREVGLNLVNLREQTDRRRAQAAASAADAANLYLWSDASDCVRLPKTLAMQVGFWESPNASRDWPSSPDDYLGATAPAETLLPSILTESLGIEPDDTAHLLASFQASLVEFNQLAISRSYPTNSTPPESRLGDLPSFTIFTPTFPEEGGGLKQRLRHTLESTLGSERAEVVWRQAMNAFTLLFNDFGEKARFETLAVRPDRTVSWWTGLWSPREARFTGVSAGGYSPGLEEVPPRFRSFIAEALPQAEEKTITLSPP
jgi:hypothetical protein